MSHLRPLACLALLCIHLAAGCDCNDSSAVGDEEPQEHETEQNREEHSFRHSRSELVAASGDPRHMAVDAIAITSAPVRLRGKIAYGATSQDLEDEEVEATLIVEGEEVGLGSTLTDEDGWARFFVGSERMPEPGSYRYRLRVLGDGTSAEGTLFLVQVPARVAVFDIDGTLTTDDGEIFEEAVLGEDAETRDGAVDIVNHHAQEGRQPVYVTGRPYPFAESTRAWLTAQGFPPGPLFTTRRVSSAAPTEDGVQEFKKAVLRELRDDSRVTIEYVYGNAMTDVCAYAEVGVASDRTFIIGPNGGAACGDRAPSVAVETYPAHLDVLRSPRVDTAAVDAATSSP